MKRALHLILFTMLLAYTTVCAQEDPAGLTESFKKGNAAQLVTYFDSKVEIIITGKNKHVSRQEAQQLIETFFTNHKVTGFQLNHQGKRDNSSFIIGALQTPVGNYRVNCFFKKTGDRYLINKIRIKKVNE